MARKPAFYHSYTILYLSSSQTQEEVKGIQIGKEEVNHVYSQMTRSYIWKIPQNTQESYRANKQIQQSFSLQDKHTKIECVYTSAMNNPKWKLKNSIYNSI